MTDEDQMPPAERAAYANGFEAGRKSCSLKLALLKNKIEKYVVMLISDDTITMRAVYKSRVDAMAAMETLRRHAVVAEVMDLTGGK